MQFYALSADNLEGDDIKCLRTCFGYQIYFFSTAEEEEEGHLWLSFHLPL